MSTQLILNINRSKVMKANIKNNNHITSGRKPLEETDSFVFLDSMIIKNGGTEEHIKIRIQKACVAFVILTKKR